MSQIPGSTELVEVWSAEEEQMNACHIPSNSVQPAYNMHNPPMGLGQKILSQQKAMREQEKGQCNGKPQPCTPFRIPTIEDLEEDPERMVGPRFGFQNWSTHIIF